MTPNAHHQVAVAGASGRMGHMLIEAIVASGDCELAGALDIASSPAIGQLASGFMGATSGPVITADLAAGLANAQVLIDFTRPEGTLAHLQVCRALGVNLVIGTTGFTEAQKAEIADAAREIAIALKMGEVIAGALGRDLKDCAVYAREGVTGERDPSSIGFATIRGGDIVGDHTVLFAGTGERIEISHKSSSRATYAQGSLRAVRFLAGRKKGLYDMADVLGLK